MLETFAVLNPLTSTLLSFGQSRNISSIEYTFDRGTMHAESGKVWYDFGASLNNCIHSSAIKALAGDLHACTVHYNYGGSLPAQATIRINVGSAFANQKLYYYRYDESSNALAFQQNASVDGSGWATVTQSSCSDYVFTTGDVTVAFATPEPTSTPAPTPVPVEPPLAGPTASGPDWILIAIIAVGILLILAIILLWSHQNRVRNRKHRRYSDFDRDFGEDEYEEDDEEETDEGDDEDEEEEW